MKILTIDFETYYDSKIQLGFKHQTTEEYVRDERFEVIGVSVQEDDNEPVWFSGNYIQTHGFLDSYDWKTSFMLAHNTQFDGFIMSHLFGIKAKGYLDTLCMARALHGVEAGGSLKALAERYGVGVKGNDAVTAEGKRRIDFDNIAIEVYGEYCKNDVVLTRKIFELMMEEFPTKELKVIDATLQMFINPILQLDLPMLHEHLEAVKLKKERLMALAEADKDTLMSNDKFAELLIKLGVEPPKKISARTGKEAWAFAKTDEEFKALEQHPDLRVQALVGARLGNKSTLEETRTQRFIEIGQRGALPVPIKYYAAHTGRWGGDDKINLQNLPSRGQNANKLKMAIKPPTGYVIIDCDSSQIEARTVAWIAGQQDLLDAFEKGEDVYKIMASAIYAKPVEDISKEERFVGKTTILGAGYGMGAVKFQAQLKGFGADVPLDECQRIISVFRTTYEKIPKLWRQAQTCCEGIISGSYSDFGVVDAIKFDPREKGFILPSGLWQRYEGLHKIVDSQGKQQYQYKTRKGMVKLYGGKVVENICQAVARCVIAEQILLIKKKYPVVLTVHDAVACIAPKDEAEDARKYVEECMRSRPAWASTLPLNCESGMGDSYGEC
jgi:DNA polymerase